MRLHPRLLALALVLLPLAAARADVVKLRDGRTLEGAVSERDGQVVVTLRKGVEVILDPGDILSIERAPSQRDELERRRTALAAGDAAGRFDLAQWCKEAGLGAERRELLLEVVKLDPDHARARADLGFVKDGDRWVPEAELRRKLGLELYRGKWLPREEAARSKRTDELRKLLLAAAFKLAKPAQAAAARAELEALKDAPDLLAPLLEERTGEHDPDVRRAFVELLGSAGWKGSGPALLRATLADDAAPVRAAGARALWRLGESAMRTELVQSLFHKERLRRERAAEALGVVHDPESVPYLIEGLEVRVARRVQETEDRASVVRDDPDAGVGLQGRFGRYNEPRTSVSVERSSEGWVVVNAPQHAALEALRKLTGRDYDFSKPDWFAWWQREGRKKLLGPDPAPAPPAPAGGR